MAISEAKEHMKSYLESQIAAVYPQYSHVKRPKGGLFIVKPNAFDFYHVRYFADNLAVAEYSEEAKANSENGISSAAVILFGSPFMKKDEYSRSDYVFKTSGFVRELSDLFGEVNLFNADKKTITNASLGSRTRNWGAPCTPNECYDRLVRDIGTAEKILPYMRKKLDNLRGFLYEERHKQKPDTDRISYLEFSIKNYEDYIADVRTALHHRDENGSARKYEKGFTWEQKNLAQLCTRHECSKNQEDEMQRRMVASGRHPMRGRRVRLETVKHIRESREMDNFTLKNGAYQGLKLVRFFKRAPGAIQKDMF